jgi:hypothetical protein
VSIDPRKRRGGKAEKQKKMGNLSNWNVRLELLAQLFLGIGSGIMVTLVSPLLDILTDSTTLIGKSFVARDLRVCC